MDPRKQLHLAAIIEHGSLAKAARHLSVSQPALSKSMNRLESELGIKLLVRESTGITPTAAGELVYTHARLIRDEMNLAETRIQGERGDAQVVTFATLPSLASSVIPLAVGRWKEHIAVVFRESQPPDSACQALIAHIQAAGTELSGAG